MNGCRGHFNIRVSGVCGVDGVPAGGRIKMNEEDDETVQEQRDTVRRGVRKPSMMIKSKTDLNIIKT
jgi:hypothetical protein